MTISPGEAWSMAGPTTLKKSVPDPMSDAQARSPGAHRTGPYKEDLPEGRCLQGDLAFRPLRVCTFPGSIVDRPIPSPILRHWRCTKLWAMNSREKRTISRIVKVNHAGEYGAIRIYRAQLWVSKWLFPDLTEFLEETLAHEQKHCALFRNAMTCRNARPCRVMALWGNGGYILGLLTALLGRQGIWICTAAVEATVHRHLDDQLQFLRDRDPDLYGLIQSIQSEELAHLNHAECRIATNATWSRALNGLIKSATNVLIWLSTWGDSSRIARDLSAAE